MNRFDKTPPVNERRSSRATAAKATTSRSLWTRENRSLITVAALATIAAFFVAAASFGFDIWSWRKSTNEPKRDVSTNGADPAIPPKVSDLAEGMCLAADYREVDCAARHRFEVIANTPDACTSDAVVEYLGGDPRLDTVLVEARHISVAEGQVCLAALGDTELVSSLRDALRGPDSAAWRRCVDDRSGPRDVACNQEHTGEYVGTSSLPESADDCVPAAEQYMDVALNRVSDRLKVETVNLDLDGQASQTCIVNVLATEVLTNTLRNIGANSLPLAQASS